MKFFITFIFFLQIGCSSVASFVTGFAGNIASDTVNRKIEKQSECKKPYD